MTALLPGIFLSWFEPYDWRAMASKLSPRTPRMLFCQLLGLLFTYFGCGRLSLLKPHQDTERMQLWVSRSSTTVSPSCLALKTISVQPKTQTFGSPQRDSAHFRGKQLWLYSDHLNQKCSSPAPKVFVPCTKRVRPLHKTCSSLAINMFVCNVSFGRCYSTFWFLFL